MWAHMLGGVGHKTDCDTHLEEDKLALGQLERELPWNINHQAKILLDVPPYQRRGIKSK